MRPCPNIPIFMSYLYKKVHCNICHVDDTIYIGKRAPSAYNIPDNLKADIVKCKRCGLMYPDPMPFADDGQLQKNYGSAKDYFPSELTADRFDFYRSILKRMERYCKKGRLLDIGCGRGEMLYVAKESGWDVLGVDVSTGFADYARHKFGVEVVTGDLKDINPACGKFDAASLISVLQHAYDPAGLLKSINQKLKNGGLLFLEVMNNASLVYAAGDLYYRLTGSDKTTNLSPTFPSYQIYGFSKRPLLKILELSGFKVISMEIEGGISQTERVVKTGFKAMLLALARKFIMIAARLLNSGQVISIYAVKERDI